VNPAAIQIRVPAFGSITATGSPELLAPAPDQRQPQH
jgi:hypothetical protein